MNDCTNEVHIIGAGLAGSECAYQLAELGYNVHLYEMRRVQKTPAHKTNDFAELVCSNSFGSLTDYSAPGQLKWEAERLNSLILKIAHKNRVPAGMALGVDRNQFAQDVTTALSQHPNITIHHKVIESIDDIPRPCIIATGPLTHEKLAQSIMKHFDHEFLYFYDAIAPIVDTESINMDIAWKADRYGKGTNDYINCPLNKDQYYNLVNEIKSARVIENKEFEDTPYFDGCMPIEEIVRRGDETLRFGPLSPKGLRHPKTDKNEYAIVQLRQDNKAATAYNMVGFQTKMAYGEQKRIFNMIPGLEDAEFLKLGSIHRNLYINSPKRLNKNLSSKKDPLLFFAGQITGVEGYFESTCIGLLVAHFANQRIKNIDPIYPSEYSAMGALLNAITEEKELFQPTNINFGLLPPIEGNEFRGRRGKERRREAQLSIAKSHIEQYLSTL